MQYKGLVFAGLIFTAATALPNSPNSDVEKDVAAVFASRCAKCHGGRTRSENKGGFSLILNLRNLSRNRQYIVPGHPDDSFIYKRIAIDQDMPPAGPIPGVEASVVKKWILGLGKEEAARDKSMSTEALFHYLRRDLEALPESDREFVRYISFDNYFFSRKSDGSRAYTDGEIDDFKAGFEVLLNSLSWYPSLITIEAVDPLKTLYRIRFKGLRTVTGFEDRGIGLRTWEIIGRNDPLRRSYDFEDAKIVYDLTRTRFPFIRADVFAEVSSKAPIYYQVLGLAAHDFSLEHDLEIDVTANIRERKVVRAATLNSGVSKNNRLIEVHPIGLYSGQFWKSYDFAGNDGQRNLFTNPLGPIGVFSGNEVFHQDAGEIIFNLPNGLQAYYIVNSEGLLVDKALLTIVSDTRRDRSEVVASVNCTGCHANGLRPMQDTLLGAISQKQAKVSDFARSFVQNVHNQTKLDAALRDGNRTYRESFEKVTNKALAERTANGFSPVINVLDEYEFGNLSLEIIAAELRLDSRTFRGLLEKIINESPNGTTAQQFKGLLLGASVKRDTFEAGFLSLIRDVEKFSK